MFAYKNPKAMRVRMESWDIMQSWCQFTSTADQSVQLEENLGYRVWYLQGWETLLCLWPFLLIHISELRGCFSVLGRQQLLQKLGGGNWDVWVGEGELAVQVRKRPFLWKPAAQVAVGSAPPGRVLRVMVWRLQAGATAIRKKMTSSVTLLATALF